MLRNSLLMLAAIALLSVSACLIQQLNLKRQYSNLNDLVHAEAQHDSVPFIKCHLQNGGVVVFQKNWELDTAAAEIRGNGTYFEFNRQLLEKGKLVVGMDSVVLYEANRLEPGIESGRVGSLLVLSFLNVSGTVLCAINPKACFGSCPTFYTAPNSTVHDAAAEGFSRAILPSLEYADVDDLDTLLQTDHFSLTMKNEALETHVLRSVELLALPGKENEQIYQSNDKTFYAGTFPHTPLIAEKGNGKSIMGEVYRRDKVDYFSPADSMNLHSREELYFEFPAEEISKDSLGLVLDYRQSLMTTYFIYSALSYMGNQATDYLSRRELENQQQPAGKLEIMERLGGIEAFVFDKEKGDWRFLGELYETGPIAINRELLPFENRNIDSTVRIKLRLNRGLWRVNGVGLTEIHRQVRPVVVEPTEVSRDGIAEPRELDLLRDPQKRLLSWPGQSRHIRYRLPDEDQSYALFLRSEGYYLEWMRDSWLEDQQLLSLRQMMKSPGDYLKDQAQPYKKYEQNMEEVFWSSQIKPNAISHYENR